MKKLKKAMAFYFILLRHLKKIEIFFPFASPKKDYLIK
jgi:hypothetical protein